MANRYSRLRTDFEDTLPQTRPTKRRWLLSIILLQGLFNGAFLWRWVRRESKNPIFPEMLYSPAQVALDYEVVTFTHGFRDDTTIYMQTPSPEVDNAWTDLYEVGIQQIDRSEAQRLPNKTYPLVGHPGQYIVGIDVFHRLHCLDMVRQALYPQYMMNDLDLGPGDSHIIHCIDSIRQSLMCTADISTVVFQWSERVQGVRAYANTAHTCRNFDLLKDWALKRQMEGLVNLTAFVEDDL